MVVRGYASVLPTFKDEKGNIFDCTTFKTNPIDIKRRFIDFLTNTSASDDRLSKYLTDGTRTGLDGRDSICGAYREWRGGDVFC